MASMNRTSASKVSSSQGGLENQEEGQERPLVASKCAVILAVLLTQEKEHDSTWYIRFLQSNIILLTSKSHNWLLPKGKSKKFIQFPSRTILLRPNSWTFERSMRSAKHSAISVDLAKFNSTRQIKRNHHLYASQHQHQQLNDHG